MTLLARSSRCFAGEFAWTRGEGGDTCPDAAALAARLATALGQPVRDALGERSLDATVAREADAWAVTLWWRGIHGATSARRSLRVAEAPCESAVEATVSSVLVALRADAVLANDNAVAAPAVPAPPPVVAAPPPVVVRPATPAPDAPHLGDVSLAFATSAGWLPGGELGSQLVVEPLVWRRLRIGVSATAIIEQLTVFSGATVGLAAMAYGVVGCGTMFTVGRWFQGSLCGGIDAGTTQLFNYSGVASFGGSRFASGVLGSLLLRTNPVGPFVFGLELGLRVPLVRYDITLNSGDHLTQSPLAFVLGVRVGLTLPGAR